MKNEYIHKLSSFLTSLSQYKYAVIVLLIGIVLLVFPQSEKQSQGVKDMRETEVALEEKLEGILKHVHGVGDVRVLLTERKGHSYEFQMDERYETKDGQEDMEKETVLVKGENGNETALITQTINPTYEGALVVCQGGGNPMVQYNVVNAVSDLTGLSSDKISVIKMKSD